MSIKTIATSPSKVSIHQELTIEEKQLRQEEENNYKIKRFSALKEAKLNEAKYLRNSNLPETVTIDKGIFKASKDALILASSVKTGWNDAETELWRDVNGNMILLTQEEFRLLIEKIKIASTPLYVKEGTLIIEINAITDLDTLEAYNVQERWEAS